MSEISDNYLGNTTDSRPKTENKHAIYDQFYIRL